MRNYFLLAAWCVILISCAAQESPNGYIFTAPRSVKIGSTNELQLLRYGDLDDGILKVRLYYSESYNSNETLGLEREFDIKKGEKISSYQLQVDPFNSIYVYNGRIEINGTMGEKEFGGSDKVSFATPKNSIIIIQTDKPLYQPGQEVKFRVVKVDNELKPSGKDDDVAEVYVEDPKETRLFQFKNVELGKGIQQLEFPLSDEPVLGTWKISVSSQNETESTNFEVKEYVLPKFDVKIKFPSFVLANTDLIPVEICAKYTYGKNVKGTLNLNTSYEIYTWSREKTPIIQETIKLDGCYNYTVNVSSLEVGIGYRSNYRRIVVTANVVEEGTGVERNATEYLQRQYSPLNLNFNQDLRQFYKPGLPYNGKLRVTNPDDSPASCEPIEICAIVSRERIIGQWFGTRKVKFCKNYTSDDNGIIKYTLPPQNTDTTSVILEAKSLKYGQKKNSNSKDNVLNQPTTSMSLSPYYSPSGSFIQLASIDKPIPCGKEKTVTLLFTSKADEDYKFRYQVLRQSEVVQTGVAEVSFSLQDDISSRFQKEDEVIEGPEIQINPPPKRTAKGSSSDGSESSEEDNCPGAKEARYVPPIGEAKIKINVDSELAPSFRLLVFYVRDDEETVADSQKFEVEKCFNNKVEFEFGDEVKQPGTKTSLTIKASPNSLCGVRVVDKSISLLDSSDQLTKERVFQLLGNMDTNNYYSTNPCYEQKAQPGLLASGKSIILPPPPFLTSTYEDALTAFQESGFLVVSDLLLFTRPCNNGGGYGGGFGQAESFDFAGPAAVPLASTARRPAQPISIANNKMGAAPTKSAVAVRDYFPETWLFDLETIGPDGKLTTKRTLPHTITEWIGNAACIDAKDGLGISNTTSIKGFQAFFISYTLPVSVIRGEEFWMVVSIFSYADAALPITVSLDQSGGFEVTSDSIDGDVCIEPDTSSNLKIKLKATELGKVNITVRAETAQSSNVCGSSSVSNAVARDAITQSFNVDPEGFPAETVRSTLFCPTDNENQMFTETYSLSVPEDVVKDSSRAYLDVTGNIMGQSIKNLNNLVALPTGCGEQNMVKFTPNYLVLDYLTDIGKLTDSVKATAIRNLNTGYQRELTYRHRDGSFSAFGEVDKDGSMFLTAFVLRSFYEAQRYIAIDKTLLNDMQSWIVSKQEEDGSFPNVGRIIDYGLEGGIKKEKNAGAITAYVVASLILSKYENETVIDKALSFLEDSDETLTPYTTFLFAYAEALGGKDEAAQAKLTAIKPRANTTDGMESYNNINGTKALDLETVAYAVLTNLKLGNGASKALPLIRYMTASLSPRGGFFSTQDTVVGLEALSKFARLVYQDPVDILVSISGGLNDKIEITEDNKLVVQRQKVDKVPSELHIEATGSGCGLIQTSLRYNTKIAPEQKKFNLGATTQCVKDDCSRRRIVISVSYAPEGKAAGMSAVEVKILSGYIPDKETLEKVKQDRQNILRVDVENNVAIFYLSEVTNTGLQFSFEIDRIVEVENMQPGTIKVYDYYAPENSATTSYASVEEP